MEEMQIWPEVLVVLIAAFVGVRGAARPGTPVARSGTGTVTEATTLVFVSPGQVTISLLRYCPVPSAICF